jgi:hypothetical protein
MTKSISDLETSLDAAFKRANKKKKLSSLAELSVVKPIIERATFYFTVDQMAVQWAATVRYAQFLRETKAPLDMQEITEALCLRLMTKSTDVYALSLDVNEFHIIAAALAAYDLHRDQCDFLLDFYTKGRSL